jgi:hypothetical protein
MQKATQRKLLMANGATAQQLEDSALLLLLKVLLSPTPSQAGRRHHLRLATLPMTMATRTRTTKTRANNKKRLTQRHV